jgi:hypothetical protein
MLNRFYHQIENKHGNLVEIFLLIIVLVYLAYINFNLPFMTVDEMDTILFNFTFENVSSMLSKPRPSAFFSTIANQIFQFHIPLPFESYPRYIAMGILYFSLILFLIQYGITKRTSILIISFIVLSHQIDWEHNGLVSFFGLFDVYLASFLLAVVIYEKYSNRLAFISVFILLLISYSTEFFFGMAFIYLFISSFLDKKHYLNPFSLTILLYLLLFFYSNINLDPKQTQYLNSYLIGSTQKFSFLEMTKVYGLYLINAIPYIDLRNQFGVISGLFLSFIIASSAMFLIIKQYNSYKINQYSKELKYIILILCLIFVPPVLMSMQEVKAEWALSGRSVKYVFSLYTWVGIVLFFHAFIKHLKLNSTHSLIIKTTSLTVILYLTILSMQLNIKFISSYSDSLKYWDYLITVAKNNDSKEIEIYSPDNNPYISVIHDQFLIDYMQKYFNKHAIINFKNFKYVIKLNGFSVQEENGRWTDTSIVSIQFNNKINTAKAINFKISDVFHYKNQKVIFNINGKAFEKEVKAGDFLKFMLNKEFNNQVMTLNIPNAISPSFLGVNNDTRQLGIKIEEISFEY